MNTLIEAINTNDIGECKRLYDSIPTRPIEIILPEYYDLPTLHQLIVSEKMELVWPTIGTHLVKTNNRVLQEVQYINQLLATIIKYGYLPENHEFITNLSTDPVIIESMRRIGWIVTVRGCPEYMEELMEVKNIAVNIVSESFNTIPTSQLMIIEYLNLRSIKHKTAVFLSLRDADYLPSLEEALQDREKLIVYLQHYHRYHYSSELLQLRTLTPDEIIKCQNVNLIEKLIELKVELPSLDSVLVALLGAGVLVNKATKMFLAIAHHQADPIDRRLVKRLIEGLNQHKQEYGAVLVVIARYKLVNLEEYREIEFIHHLLELTVSKTKSFRRVE